MTKREAKIRTLNKRLYHRKLDIVAELIALGYGRSAPTSHDRMEAQTRLRNERHEIMIDGRDLYGFANYSA